MTFKKSLLFIALSTVFISACSEQTNTTSNVAVSEQSKESTEIKNVDASAQANQLFDAIFMEGVARSPMMQTYLGMKTDYGKWDDISDKSELEEFEITKNNLLRIQKIDTSKLDHQTLLSYQLLEQKLQNKIDDHQWRYYNYPVNQMHGLHSQVPAFLINQHAIKSEQDAQDYISRLVGIELLLTQLVEQLKIREEIGIVPPKFVFAHVIRDSKNILVGAPFIATGDENATSSTLLADFEGKLDKLELSEDKKNQLLKQANAALLAQVKPGYQTLINYLTELESKADDQDGVWKFPQGKDFYNNALKRTTTTDLTADDIHALGLKEVARIHNEMRSIMKKVDFDGDLAAFFDFMRHDKQFYYADDEAGRSRYLTEATALIDEMKGHLDELFITKPKADLVVKRVEGFREKSAGKAFYQQPAPDGSRPGLYYANLYKMEAMPTYQMAALAYHEGIPGHHMQIALKQELEGIPKFRKFGGYTVYSEGWGLYSEMIPKEIGFYQNPYDDFGRLAMELWRACRLVVDTGIHSKKWTREQGINYYVTNTPNAESDAVKMVERHVVMASQATAYKIGMLKFIELREKAKLALGDKFDIRQYHEVVLTNGPVPLNVLENLVDIYIKETK